MLPFKDRTKEEEVWGKGQTMGLDLEMLRLGFLWNKEHGCPPLEQLLFQLGDGAGQAVLGLIRAPMILLPAHTCRSA